jgi:hypothetical protein
MFAGPRNNFKKREMHSINLFITKLNDTTLNHFPVQVIALSSAFSNTSKHRETTYQRVQVQVNLKSIIN